jgi:chromosome segregation ATPase
MSRLWLVGVCALVTPMLSAQAPAGNDAQAKKFYEDLIKSPIIPQRSADAVRADLDDGGKKLLAADTAIADAQGRIKEAEGWLATNKSEMDALKAKINTAKKEKRESDKVTLEGQQKQLDLVDEYLKKTKDLRDAELDIAKAQKELVSAQTNVCKAEEELRKQSEGIKSVGPTDPNLTKTVLAAASAGESTAKVMKALADKNQDYAGRLTRLADRRIDLVQARNKLLSEDRIRSFAASSQK